MEGLIIMAVIALLTRFFSGNGAEQKNEQKPPAAMPPFSNDKPLSKPIERRETMPRKKPVVEVKSLEDFAQEVFGQLQQKSEQAPPVTVPPKKAVVIPTQVASSEPLTRAEQSTRPVFQNRAETSRTGLQERKELGADRSIIQRNKKRAAVTIPTTRKELVQSVVMAEVLGQPKAKRPHRI